MQTIIASKFLKAPKTSTKQQRIELPDGDFLDVSWSKKHSGPIVCLFHGLAGSIHSAYIQSAFHALEAAGMRPALMHWRGCSGEPNRIARSYHSGATDDIKFFIDYSRNRYPDTPILAAAYSLGANALLKYLGESKYKRVLTGAVAVCPPLVLSVGADKLNTGLTRVYQRHLLSAMRQQHEQKRTRYPELNLPAASKDLNTFWKFDNVLTAPLHGFGDVHNYYEKCSSRQFLNTINVPTHIIYALDDPFFTPAVVPTKAELSDAVTLELSEYGGHVGFIGPIGQPSWLAQRITHILANFL